MLIGYVLIALGLILLFSIIVAALFIAQLKFIFKTFWRCYYEVKKEYNIIKEKEIISKGEGEYVK